MQVLARHPLRDEVLIGGTDGIPQIYRMKRITVRKIGDNANLIRKFPAMQGRIFGVDFAPDGKRTANRTMASVSPGASSTCAPGISRTADWSTP